MWQRRWVGLLPVILYSALHFTLGIQFRPVQSLDRLGRRGDMMDDSAEIFFLFRLGITYPSGNPLIFRVVFKIWVNRTHMSAPVKPTRDGTGRSSRDTAYVSQYLHHMKTASSALADNCDARLARCMWAISLMRGNDEPFACEAHQQPCKGTFTGHPANFFESRASAV